MFIHTFIHSNISIFGSFKYNTLTAVDIEHNICAVVGNKSLPNTVIQLFACFAGPKTERFFTCFLVPAIQTNMIPFIVARVHIYCVSAYILVGRSFVCCCVEIHLAFYHGGADCAHIILYVYCDFIGFVLAQEHILESSS